jgi:alpha-amylase
LGYLAALESAKLKAADFTEASWTAYQLALAAARSEAERPTSQGAVDLQLAALRIAVDALVRGTPQEPDGPGGQGGSGDSDDLSLSGQPSALDVALSSLRAMTGAAVLLDAASLTPESVAIYAQALAEATRLLEGPATSVEAVNAAIARLSAAAAGLKAKAADLRAVPDGGNPPVATTPGPTLKVKLSQKRLTLVKGTSLSVPVRLYSDSLTAGAASAVTWKSSNTAIAKVSSSGAIRAIKPGVVTITASSKAKSAAGKASTATISVRVLPKRTAARVSKVWASGLPKTLTVGATAFVTGKYSSANAAAVKVTYRATKPGVLSVDKVGKVSAVSKGTGTIVVSAGGKSVKYRISVE